MWHITLNYIDDKLSNLLQLTYNLIDIYAIQKFSNIIIWLVTFRHIEGLPGVWLQSSSNLNKTEIYLNFRGFFIFNRKFFWNRWKHVVGAQLTEVNVNLVFNWVQLSADILKVRTIIGISQPALKHELVQIFRTVLRLLKPLARFQKVQKILIVDRWVRKSAW